MKQDSKRCSGRTLGLALQSLGKAVENPGMEVEFIDHHEQNFAQLQYCKERIEKITKQLNLDVSVNNWARVHNNMETSSGLYVKSNWISPYSQSKAAEEKWKEIYGYCPDKRQIAWHYFLQGFEEAQND